MGQAAELGAKLAGLGFALGSLTLSALVAYVGMIGMTLLGPVLLAQGILTALTPAPKTDAAINLMQFTARALARSNIGFSRAFLKPIVDKAMAEIISAGITARAIPQVEESLYIHAEDAYAEEVRIIAAEKTATAQLTEAIRVQLANIYGRFGGLETGVEAIDSDLASLAAQLGVTEASLSSGIQEAATSLINWIATNQGATAAEIKTQADRVINEALAAITGAKATTTMQSDRVINTILDDLAAKHSQDMEQGEATRTAVESTAAEVGGAGAALDTIVAGGGAGVLSMAGMGLLMNTMSSNLGRNIHQGRAACIGTTGSALLGVVQRVAIPAMLIASYKLQPEVRRLVDPLIDWAWKAFLAPLTDEAPITPEKAPHIGATLFANALGAGLAAHLASQAAESTASLKFMGMPYIAAFLADMGAFSRISAATLGPLITIGLGQPFRYSIQSQLRPWLLSPFDFFSLFGREAFRNPEALRTPGLTESVDEVTEGDRDGFIDKMIGYYGYPASYRGMFRELANKPLGYFPLAGIARTGFFDETWFMESVQRTGYAVTTRQALMDMYKEMALAAKLGPNFFQLRRLSREHFITIDELRNRMDAIKALPDVTEARVYAIELEREYEIKDLTLDIITRSFTRGLISEMEAISSLIRLGLPSEIAELQILREKLGLVRKIKLEAPEIPQTWEVVEESELS